MAGCAADSSANVGGRNADGTAVLSWEPSDSIYQPGTVYTAVPQAGVPNPATDLMNIRQRHEHGEAASMVVLNANGTMSVQTVFAATEGTSSTTDTRQTPNRKQDRTTVFYSVSASTARFGDYLSAYTPRRSCRIFLWRILRKE